MEIRVTQGKYKYRYTQETALFFNSFDMPSNHPLNHPKHSVPDAESQRQHDSWPTQWGLFKFPGKDSHRQEAKYSAYDFGEHFIFSYTEE